MGGNSWDPSGLCIMTLYYLVFGGITLSILFCIADCCGWLPCGPICCKRCGGKNNKSAPLLNSESNPGYVVIND